MLQIPPALFGDPLVWLCLFYLGEGLVALEEEVEFGPIEVEFFLVDHDGHVEGEHQLVHLEDTEAGVFVDVEGKFVDDGSQTGLEHGVFLGVSEGVVEDGEIGGQTVLIHLTDAGESAHGEEEHCAATGHWSVGLSSHFDLLGSDLSFLDVLGDFGGDLLGGLEGHDERLVVEQTA